MSLRTIELRAHLRVALLGLGLLGVGCGVPPEGMSADLRTADGGMDLDMGPAGDMGQVMDPCITVRCSAGFVCREGMCVADGATAWVLTVTTGVVSALAPDGSAWDPLGGSPDAYVCLTFAGKRQCTATRDDTLRPVWNEAFPAAPANNLLGGIVVEMWDKDVVDPDDAICDKDLYPLTEADLSGRRWSAVCPRGSFEATLRPL